ncbi:hypothetical protein BZM27_40655 [Paraburkholderia steynii]|uniref:Uncharacterized protein n=1 Tax=Paraburkholderia steynii TaxID=1245441 RepID=A0A4R0X7J2_9BURK|nr:hypothetical protein BZM27_40655 [Paraburkholderia steynii]
MPFVLCSLAAIKALSFSVNQNQQPVVRDQCEAAGVPFLFKQWGERQIASTEDGYHDCDMSRNNAHWVHFDGA